jgi:predicted MPP superfamily phosphohydrolase
VKKDKIVVIDDELDKRREYYDLFLDDYDIVYIQNKDEYQKLFHLLPLISFIIIDLKLDNGEMNIDKILADIKNESEDIPIVMVSQYWNTIEAPVSDMIRYVQNYNIATFLAWEKRSKIISNKSAELKELTQKWRQDIRLGLARYKKYTVNKLDDDESVWMVHAGDFQFGAQEDSSIFGDDARLANIILTHTDCQPPKLIFVCGDVAEHGKYEDYDKAEIWMNNFLDILYKKKPQGSIFFTNGNHDCNFSAFAKYHCNCMFDSSSKCKLEIKQKIENMADTEKAAYEHDKRTDRFNKTIYLEFIDFIRKYIPKNLFEKAASFNYVYDYFVPWGIRIICINTVDKISLSNKDGIGINEEKIKEIGQYCLNNKPENLFTILMSHHGPHELGYLKQSEEENKWPIMENLLRDIGVNLWLTAHRHEYAKEEIMINLPKGKKKKMIYLATGTIRLPNNRRPEDAKKGFNIIELKRRGDSINSVRILKMKIEKGLCQLDGNAISYTI